MRTVLFLSMVAAATTGCASARPHGPMQRALDASMERAGRTESYIRAVAGITGDASRLTRGDGFVYLADIAPTLRFLGLAGDSVSYRKLRKFVETTMIAHDVGGAPPRRRYRPQTNFEAASPYAVRRLADALALGWQTFGDTASAVLAASLRSGDEQEPTGSPSDVLVQRCMAVDASVRVDPAAARKLIAASRKFRPGQSLGQESRLDFRGIDGDLVALACLTRLSMAVRDPDATVRYLDRMLERMAPFLLGSGRPDTGASADVLQALHEVGLAGPSYFRAK